MPTLTSPHRRLFDIDLKPVAGVRFQPTGFPDIGPARFKYPPGKGINASDKWRDAILVESAQSMANRLEAVGWDTAAEEPSPALAGLPYLRVVAADDGRYLTSSRTEPHRLAAGFVKDAEIDGTEVRELIGERLGLRDDTPLAPREIAGAVFQLDPLCLVHGVFFADKKWPGQPRIARAVTGFIEAIGVEEAVSGGVKRDAVRHALGDQSSGGTQEGYGTIPYHRTEFTAERIVAHVAIDRAQIASYGLGEAAEELLETIALWELRCLLDGGLRLRTACDLARVHEDVADLKSGEKLASQDVLAERLRGAIRGCVGLLGDGKAITAVWGGAKKAR